MSIIYIFILLAFVVAILEIIANLKEKGFGSESAEEYNLPYNKRDYFFSKSEREFFILLRDIMNDKFTIFSKPRILDLIKVPKSDPNHTKYQNKIQSKHVDFVICDREWFQPLLIIELDDSSHEKPGRIERDNFVDKAFKSAGIPIIHIRNSESKNRTEVYQKLKPYLVPGDK